jgi:haloacetate dehalogenase
MTIAGFTAKEVIVDGVSIFVCSAGAGPPLLLLHGFPQTHLMWRQVAPRLAETFTVVCADLRGYGRSGCPASDPDHAPYSKRAMAGDMAAVMAQLGLPRFSVVGHDRGGRVAYRLALDHPERIERTAVLDIVPTEMAWARADARFALAFWPWSLLAQAAPLPEHILMASADAIVEHALTEWGTSAAMFTPDVRAAYAGALRDPLHAHAICEEYRAAATLDRVHDRADRTSGRRLTCPLLVLWSASGPLASWYEQESGPLGLWRSWADDVRGHALAAGHFFPEEAADDTAAALRAFFGPRVPESRD